MIPLSCPHTHTQFCDGANTAREMIQAAITIGLKSIGFTGHSFTEHDTSYCMSKKQTRQYILQIKSLKKEFASKINIYLGIELDATSHIDLTPFDYIIGSVHYLKDEKNHYWSIDESPQQLQKCCETVFGGNAFNMVKAYYQSVKEMALRVRPNIIGHYDLITKYGHTLFNDCNTFYQAVALEPIADIVQTGAAFEINSGAIFAQHAKNPYPSPFILRHIKKTNGTVILSSDAHCISAIGFYWDEMLTLIKQCGFSSMKILNNDGISFISV